MKSETKNFIFCLAGKWCLDADSQQVEHCLVLKTDCQSETLIQKAKIDILCLIRIKRPKIINTAFPLIEAPGLLEQ